VRIWLYSGAEPGTWDLSVAKGSTVYSDFQLDHIIFDDARVEWDFIRFFYAGEGGLEYRSEETGVLLDSAALAVAPESSRRTPDGQHIFIQQGTDTLVRYNRRLELEDTVTISGFFPVQDWNADDQFNLFRLDGNVLYRYHADGYGGVGGRSQRGEELPLPEPRSVRRQRAPVLHRAQLGQRRGR
jgi:hypothetical protein